MKYILGWMKTHFVVSVVAGIVVVSAIVTPIVLWNQNNNTKPKDDVPEIIDQDNEKEQEVTCEEGFILNEDNICEEIKQEEPVSEEENKESNHTSNSSTQETNNNKTESNKQETKPKEEVTPTPTPTPDPLKKYCDNHIAGYSNESGICVDLYPDDHCSYGSACFGGGHPSEDLYLSYDGDVSKYPGGEEQYNKDVANWEEKMRQQVQRTCSSRGYGWTDALDKTFGNCTW